jgi:hypothetical protein
MAFSRLPGAGGPAAIRAFIWTPVAIFLAAVTGFNGGTAELPPGATPCFTNATPPGFGNLLFAKSALYLQNDANTLIPAPDSPLALIEISPPLGIALSNVEVAGPNGLEATLRRLSDGTSRWTNGYPSEVALNSAVPAGPWVLRFDATPPGDSAPFFGFMRFTPRSNLPPIPAITNHAAAQAINPDQAFTLHWNEWMGITTNDRISLEIRGPQDQRVFSAATDCVAPVAVAPGATSVEIPAGTLRSGTIFTGYLSFGASLLELQDDAALQVVRGIQARTTRFLIRSTGPVSTDTATLENFRVSGTNLLFVVLGTGGAPYQVQSSADLTTWTDERRIVMPASGRAIVQLPVPPDGAIRFFRAIGASGRPPRLVFARNPNGTGYILNILEADPGRLYRLQLNDGTWGEWYNWLGLTAGPTGNISLFLPPVLPIPPRPLQPPRPPAPREIFIRAVTVQ